MLNLAPLIALAWLPFLDAAAMTMTVESCEDLQAAAAATSTTDVLAEIEVESITCDEWTTMEITNNRLKLVNPVSSFTRTVFSNVRFLVTSGVFRVDLSASFTSDYSEDVNSALLHVAEGARARVLSTVWVEDVGVTDSTSGTGGCIHNEGLLRIDGDLALTRCRITDTTGSLVPSGGGIWNGEMGEVVIKGFFSIRSCSATSSDDSAESKGGAIYNKGKLTFFSTSEFESNQASVGGGIYNEGVVKFINYPGTFSGNRASGQGGGHVFNSGTMLFKGGGMFYSAVLLQRDSDGGAIINTGSITIEQLAIFQENQCQRYGGAIATNTNATLKITENAIFSGNYVSGYWDPYDCDDIYIENATGYTCEP